MLAIALITHLGHWRFTCQPFYLGSHAARWRFICQPFYIGK